MKRTTVITAALLASLAGGVTWHHWPKSAQAPVAQAPATPPPTHTSADGTGIFQKAFWKRPSADDRILHAERREWKDASGVQQWAWFLIVEPSAALVKHLRDDNAFHLSPKTGVPLPEKAPTWFTLADGSPRLVSPTGQMQVSFSADGKTLHACAHGLGFRPGSPTPAPAVATSAPMTSGRLPLTSPNPATATDRRP